VTSAAAASISISGRHEYYGESMLKIERSTRGEFVVFSLSGRIGIEDVAYLKRLFEAEGQSVIMDLKEVTLVDRETVGFLARFESDRIKVENCPAYIREWIARERDQTTGD
jgi:hypothetical protein